MARNQQPMFLRQQVERLVTEGKKEEAFSLLNKRGWVPGGSGHQEYYPNGLTLFTKVDWEKQILVSKSGRYWAWKVSLLSPGQYTFLYPTSREFPFDEICSKIIHELEKRNWKVGGIKVEFHTYGTGAEKYRMVNSLEGKDFKLWFCRVQRTMWGGRLNDTAAIHQINIPKMELSVYEDESGPSLEVYVGSNWEKDRDSFVHRIKTNSKLNKEPRTYLKYSGSWQTPEESGPHYVYPGQRAPYLVHDDDLGREYGLTKGDIAYYRTEDVMEIFRQWLFDNLLKKIESTPISQHPLKKGQLPDQPPIPENIGPFFCFAEPNDAQRIKEGQENPANLGPFERYGLNNNGERLVHLGISNDGTIPEVAYDGFLWCGIGEITPETSVEKFEIPGFYRWSDRDWYVIKITPKSANGVYIADISTRESYKAKIFENNPNQYQLTNIECQEFLRATGRTIIPITDYKGGFGKPVVLINRELGLDEVEIIDGILYFHHKLLSDDWK